ncbi:MAG: flagellin, partial [Planctomycetota bacterium]
QQNRLGSTLRSLANVRENTSAAESRIRDVDIAMETADLTRNSILQQAATSILSQANQQPQLALSLLG